MERKGGRGDVKMVGWSTIKATIPYVLACLKNRSSTPKSLPRGGTFWSCERSRGGHGMVEGGRVDKRDIVGRAGNKKR
jgi:hypothetical protein